jgi:hypothetical protein
MPFFSIVIPTRQRAHLLRYALQSALEQTFDDYEIIVSNNGADQATERIVIECGNGKVRYFRTDDVLSMPDHWEFALAQARGEYVTFLCDDDAIFPDLLSNVSYAIQTYRAGVVSWLDLQYVDRPWGDERRKNQLVVFPYTSRLVPRNSRDELDRLFRLKDRLGIPKMLNSCCHRTVIDSVKKQAGRFFLPVAPDYSSCAATLAVQREYVFIDEPLMIAGLSVETKSQATILRFAKEFHEELFQHVPLSAIIGRNSIAESLLRVKHAMPDEFCGLELDWAEYFLRCHQELRTFRQYGVDVGIGLEEFSWAIARQPSEVRSSFYLKQTTAPIKRMMKKVVYGIMGNSSTLRRAKARLKGQVHGATAVISGDKVNCHNILDWVRSWRSFNAKQNTS